MLHALKNITVQVTKSNIWFFKFGLNNLFIFSFSSFFVTEQNSRFLGDLTNNYVSKTLKFVFLH